MIYVKYIKYVFSIGHLWFGDNLPMKQAKPDILYMHGQKKNRGGYDTLQHTLITDLRENEDSLYSKIRKNYRYEIRRAAKENVQLQFYSAEEMQKHIELLSNFAETYNQMYKSKGLNIRFNMPLVEQYIEKNAICFSIAFFDGEPLVYHSYILDQNNVRFFYSSSPFRVRRDVADRIGRMNKALHWFDLKLFKQRGVLVYDWGGIANPNDPNGIDRFKLGFGGEPKDYYNCILGLTLIGKFIVFLLKMKNQKRG